MREKYKTKQKQAIAQYMAALGSGHATVAGVAQHMQLAGTPVGTATIYRHLENMVEEGLVKKYMLGAGRGACYQYLGGGECGGHYHFKCGGCGTVLHIHCGTLAHLQQHIAQEHGFYADMPSTVFMGECAACRGE